VLVIPKRKEIKRFIELNEMELHDLFKSVKLIGKVIEEAYKAKSLTISIQDGPFAGQSVPHLHVHILPRHPQDFTPNDKV
ncbi:hypothetical protein CROQUDRAFT_29490, partial [Cronartium quercuum f. sp. fusiforme G11]